MHVMIFTRLVLLCTILLFATCAQSKSPKLPERATRVVQRALARVHLLQSRHICRLRAILRKKSPQYCGWYSPGMMARAISHLEHVAKNDRIRRGIPAPSFRTRIVEPFEPVSDATMLFLHGFGPGLLRFLRDLIPVMRKGSFLPRVRFIMPEAKVLQDPFFNRLDVSWFPIPIPGGEWDQDAVFGASDNVTKIVDMTSTILCTSRDRAGVTGVSQGGMVAITVYLQQAVAAVATLVAIFPVDQAYPAAMTPLSADKKMIFFSAENDQLVPTNVSELSVQALRALGRDVTYVEVKGVPHELDEERVPTLERGMRFVYNQVKKVKGAIGKNIVAVPNLDIQPIIWELE